MEIDDDDEDDVCPYKVQLTDLGECGFLMHRHRRTTGWIWVSEYWLSRSGGIRKQLRLVI